MPRAKRPSVRDGEGPSHGRSQANVVPQPPDDYEMQRIRLRGVVMEEHLDLNELRNTTIPARVVEQGWDRLVAPKPQANITLVHEFYYAIKPGLYKNEGVLVRGVRVPFNQSVLNRFYGLPDFPEYERGFPESDTYTWDDVPEYLADQLRQFPRAGWVPGARVNHAELPLHLAVWNVFVSRIISPVDTHQILRNDHPKILLAINYGERFDVGNVMCRALDRNLRTGRFIVLPCTITAICRQAGVNVELPGDRFIPEARAIGTRVWNRLARDRHIPPLDRVPAMHGEDEQVGGDEEDTGDADVDEMGHGADGGGDGDLARELRETRSQIVGGLTRIAHSLRRLSNKVDRIDRNMRRD